MIRAYSIRVRGVVQGVGFRPFVYRLACANELCGWVLNGEEGVEIHIEGESNHVHWFLDEMESQAPQAAVISDMCIEAAELGHFATFEIRKSNGGSQPTVRISPDLSVCEDCLRELFDRTDRRYRYPYINCTNCGPRYSVIRNLPYDRPNTTMAAWPLDALCESEYHNPADRRFHAQPVACPACGPHFVFRAGSEIVSGGESAIRNAANFLSSGKIVAVKGLGGYHLACDAKNVQAVSAMRARKFRKEKPFALMVRNIEVAGSVVYLNSESASLLNSAARPIVLAPSQLELPEVAPNSDELGVMLPYTPLHHLLFAEGAPDILVMTSANRSSEPIAYQDDTALRELAGIADGFLIGERPIARRVDDSVVRAGAFGPAILRRARGYAPGVASVIPNRQPILALGADLKNTITLVVDGQAFVSQHIGDLSHYEAFCAFRETIQDLLAMYEIDTDHLLLAHDFHPQYVSTQHALELPALEKRGVQHHCAHIASVLAESGEWHRRVLGVSFDGTGYGDDGTIWGGEMFSGSIVEGFERVAHLRTAALPGGDAAACCPVQSAAGFLSQLGDPRDFAAKPFSFSARYAQSLELVRTGVRCFPTTSMGRLFDTVAALLGFDRDVTFEGQAAMWVEHLARNASNSDGYSFPLVDDELDFRPLLEELIRDRLRGRDIGEIARAFQRGIAVGLIDALTHLCRQYDVNTIVLSGGVFQNELLLRDVKGLMQSQELEILTNHIVPANDSGISLGQAAVAAMTNHHGSVAGEESLEVRRVVTS
jgi:hydrogenase maturation protein HypF